MAKLSTYTLATAFNAPALVTGSAFANAKLFAAGQKVKGVLVTEKSGLQFISTVDGFAIPLSAIDMPSQPKPIEAAAPVATKDTKADAGEKKPMILPKEIQEKLNAIKSTDVTANILKQARASVNGLMVGAGVGFLFALIKKKPYWASILVGAVGGGLTGNFINKRSSKK